MTPQQIDARLARHRPYHDEDGTRCFACGQMCPCDAVTALRTLQRVLALNPADLDAADDHYLIGYGEETRCSCGRWTFYPDETEYDLHRAEVVRDRIRSAITGGTDE